MARERCGDAKLCEGLAVLMQFVTGVAVDIPLRNDVETDKFNYVLARLKEHQTSDEEM
eukprot:CAMPEP_0115390970 /NCGR_PEP_ID=MMETSP0271-20121206/10473_1 /TAXON_ID=71861 /ORGANISM="Scrippsiella trochoidea, Strain CCMP3099" /LENGTH=57 /DNA_ID=CAMNT_0002814523 /DNA_START=386 /DNA_END=559 /DNA_ORIENTATION=+